MATREVFIGELFACETEVAVCEKVSVEVFNCDAYSSSVRLILAKSSSVLMLFLRKGDRDLLVLNLVNRPEDGVEVAELLPVAYSF